MKFLKYIRIVLSILFFLPIFLFFIDFAGKLPLPLHLLLSVQWIPALLSMNLVVLGILLVLNLFFGRIYCSIICPLGVMQDVLSWKSQFFRKKRKKIRYGYAAPKNILRYSILSFTLIVFIFGSSFLVILLDPYSTFGRIASQLFRPLAIWGNNALAYILSGMGNYTFYKVEQVSFVPFAFGIALVFFLLITQMSWFKGRSYCNTICPVGTSLGLLSKISIFHISISESSCTHCGACEKQCKSQCIDSKTMKVDDSRCVSCFNCISACKKNGITYEMRYNKVKEIPIEHKVNNSRRTFLLSSGAAIASVALSGTNKIIGNNDPILSRKPVMPPGAKSIQHFNEHCTGCQLCVTKCPMQVLKPAALQYGLTGIMQPHLSFSTHIFCTYDCNICTNVCPTGALIPLGMEDKKLTQIGTANFRKTKCVVFAKEEDCGACSEHCPTQAVHMIPYKNGLTIPEVTKDLCIGCGACESICPVRPYQAIYVEGSTNQGKARKPAEAKKFNKKIDSFGF
jgi:ferredoxin